LKTQYYLLPKRDIIELQTVIPKETILPCGNCKMQYFAFAKKLLTKRPTRNCNIRTNFVIQIDTRCAMNIQAEKAIIIEQFRQVNDVNLIHAIKNMLDYALTKEKQNDVVPEAHQKLVNSRFDTVRKNPERLLDWDEAVKTLKS